MAALELIPRLVPRAIQVLFARPSSCDDGLAATVGTFRLHRLTVGVICVGLSEDRNGQRHGQYSRRKSANELSHLDLLPPRDFRAVFIEANLVPFEGAIAVRNSAGRHATGSSYILAWRPSWTRRRGIAVSPTTSLAWGLSAGEDKAGDSRILSNRRFYLRRESLLATQSACLRINWPTGVASLPSP